jgi:hypothetical protein
MMTKIYYATTAYAEDWEGPFESEDLAISHVQSGPDGDVKEIWIAPADEDTDDDDAFWFALADHLIVWGVEAADQSLVEDGWLNPWEAWSHTKLDRDGIIAIALRQVLGPRPAWRSVDTSKARRVEL